MSPRRSLLAGLWSLVGLLTTAGFVIAISFAIASQKYDPNYNNGNYYNNDDREEDDRNQNNNGVITVTSRAMVFAAIWTAILSGILVIYGTVLLGVRMPFTGKYYSCCLGNVHRMTPLTLGSFAGSLLMFANLTLVCAILFGEFQIIPSFGERGDQNQNNEEYNNTSVVDDSSYAFSVLCIFFTGMYAAFAILIFYFSNSLLEESVADARGDTSVIGERSSSEMDQGVGYIGGNRFDVVGRKSYGGKAANNAHRHEVF
mmetsp:Transcript_18772/g.28048  ORF Transcript_18772/g.28048 Transcript_18772/m.28048 type:complete len:258 (+) Transcript_18772:82-855(+)